MTMKDDNKPADEMQALMKTGKAAEFLGVPHRTFKFWIKAGKLIPDFVSDKGYNFFSEENLARFKSKAGNENTQDRTQNAQSGQSAQKAGNQTEKTGNEIAQPDLTYVDDESKKIVEKTALIPASTYFSPKDKVSNMTWSSKIPCNENKAIITVQKSDDFGCIVRLNYDKIFADEHVITGANFSDFDRTVYDAVVTIMVAGNNVFNNIDIWQTITQNPKAKLTDTARLKIAKSMFHIGNFLISIITDYDEKPEAWDEINSDSKERPFKSERKFYKKLQTLYGGRLLEFRWIAERSVKITQTINGQEITKTEYVPEIWQFLAPPILYQYAADKGQVASIAINLLNITSKIEKKPALKRGTHTDELTNFLAREIDTMKKNQNTYNRNILLERLYSIDGISEVQKNNNNVNFKKKSTRDKIAKILSRFKENGMIQGHIFHKKVIGKATTFYSVEILV